MNRWFSYIIRFSKREKYLIALNFVVCGIGDIHRVANGECSVWPVVFDVICLLWFSTFDYKNEQGDWIYDNWLLMVDDQDKPL